jgi:hypothetical protein
MAFTSLNFAIAFLGEISIPAGRPFRDRARRPAQLVFIVDIGERGQIMVAEIGQETVWPLAPRECGILILPQ